ncbi:hypothetical protein [Caenibius sp. WL]|uniref:hypothetical protein n=1 Tax=Caenibius sp. WL TaxID=2872646 RepID=UPI001C9A0227|nr:hypothetical protein [Caenibius sp. WL]QZP08201.1 hypothetical protein K5X80_16470 [Caenibius sp. WL]
MKAQLILLAITLVALALPAFGLKSGKLPDFGYVGAEIDRERRPRAFWFLFSVYSFMAGALVACFIGRATGLIP